MTSPVARTDAALQVRAGRDAAFFTTYAYEHVLVGRPEGAGG